MRGSRNFRQLGSRIQGYIAFLCSTQSSMKFPLLMNTRNNTFYAFKPSNDTFNMLINAEMRIMVGILQLPRAQLN